MQNCAEHLRYAFPHILLIASCALFVGLGKACYHHVSSFYKLSERPDQARHLNSKKLIPSDFICRLFYL
jgi:hypothetical protein